MIGSTDGREDSVEGRALRKLRSTDGREDSVEGRGVQKLMQLFCKANEE